MAIRVITPLALHGISAPASTIGTASAMVPDAGATTLTNHSTRVAALTGYGEIYSQGTTSTWAAAGAVGAQSGHGFLWDADTLERQQLVSGMYSAAVSLSTSAGTATADIIARFSIRHSDGSYTTITKITLAGQSLTTSFTIFTLTGADLIQPVLLRDGDKLYCDVWLNVTVNGTGGGTSNLRIGSLSTNSLGAMGNFWTTPGYAAVEATGVRYRIQIRDHALVPIGELPDYIDGDLVLNFNDVSTFAFTVRASNNPMAQYFAEGYGIIVSRDRGDGSGAQALISGPIWHLERRGKDDAYVLAGPSDMWWLKARLVIPAALADYDARTGTASTTIRAYVNAHAGPGATSSPVDFRVFGLAMAADPSVGSSVKGNARYDNLLALIQQLAISGGDLGFRVTQTGVGVLTFEVYAPVAPTNAIFSTELRNLLDFVYSIDGPQANYDLAAGGGDLAARTIVTDYDAGSVSTWGLVMGFLDTRDTSDTTTMTQRIDADLAQNAQQTNLSITPQDTDSLQFGRDYTLGDTVSVEVDGTTITDIVRQVHIQLNGTDQEVITPGIGNAGSGKIAALFDAKQRALNAVAAKLARLQAAQ